jgi:glutamyl-tRNA reductase
MSAATELRSSPAVAALQARADAIVAELLRQNEGRWVALGERDRARVETLARTVAHRLLHEPAARLERAGGDGDATGYAAAVRELFALDG